MFAKKNLIAVAALATLAVSAQAQSSVTLYGNLDAGLTYSKVKQSSTDTSASTTGVTSSILTESFFGLKGQEELGGGLKAIFKLESFVNVDTGSVNGNFWGKNAYVGLAGDFGTVKLGNQESLFKTEAGAFDAFGVSPVLAVSKLFVGDEGSWQNTVGYTSPSFGGLTVSAQHSFKEGTKKTNADSYNGGATAVAVNYAAGALGLSAVYGDIRTTDTNTDTQSEQRDRAFLLGASYDFGVVKAFAQYGQNKSETRTTEDPKDKFFQLGAVVPVTQAGAVHAAYGQVKAGDAKARKFSLAYHHALSKRTSAYAGVTYVKDEYLQDDTVTGTAAGVGSDAIKTTTVAVGVRHAF